jgi:hypothetical protein
MKLFLPKLFIIAFCISLATDMYSQNDRYAYAITDVQQEGFNWTSLRKLDLITNTYSDILLQGNNPQAALYNAADKKQLTPQVDKLYGNMANAPFVNGVAAIAYDKANNRIWFTPMLIDQLRYIDLGNMQVYVADKPLTGVSQKATDQSDIITRMTIGNDGYVYAISNDGKRFYQVTASKKKGIVVTDLGQLVDAPENKSVSIYNNCTSYGGDMVADDDGNLFILSARNHVFSVNTKTKVATHLGLVTGLPATFTMNGAAVTADGKNIVITSATDNSGIYQLDVKTLAATALTTTEKIWRTSDLANSNILRSGKKEFGTPDMLAVVSDKTISNTGVEVFPNPVTEKTFTVQLKDMPAGTYTVKLLDGSGKQVLQRTVNSSGKVHNQQLNLPAITTSGIYLLQIVNNEKHTIYSHKLMVQ